MCTKPTSAAMPDGPGWSQKRAVLHSICMETGDVPVNLRNRLVPTGDRVQVAAPNMT